VRVVESPTHTSGNLQATSSIDPLQDLLNRPDGTVYRNAVETSIAGCMGSRGWVYAPRIGDPAREYGAGTGPTDPNALLQYREHYGYGYLNPSPSDSEAQAHIDVQNQHYFQALTPEAKLRYTSDLGSGPDERFLGTTTAPNSGCRATAETAERKVIPRLSHTLEHALSTRWNAIFSDPAYVAAQQQWSECMLRAGFHFEHTSDAQGSISNLFAPPPNDPHSQAAAHAQATAHAQAQAAALEIRTGTADARCAAPTVWPVQQRLELAVLQDVINRYGRNAVCGPSCH
jgi:hypothetical protein